VDYYYTTQICEDYFKNQFLRLPIKQTSISWKVSEVFIRGSPETKHGSVVGPTKYMMGCPGSLFKVRVLTGIFAG